MARWRPPGWLHFPHADGEPARPAMTTSGRHVVGNMSLVALRTCGKANTTRDHPCSNPRLDPSAPTADQRHQPARRRPTPALGGWARDTASRRVAAAAAGHRERGPEADPRAPACGAVVGRTAPRPHRLAQLQRTQSRRPMPDNRRRWVAETGSVRWRRARLTRRTQRHGDAGGAAPAAGAPGSARQNNRDWRQSSSRDPNRRPPVVNQQVNVRGPRPGQALQPASSPVRARPCLTRRLLLPARVRALPLQPILSAAAGSTAATTSVWPGGLLVAGPTSGSPSVGATPIVCLLATILRRAAPLSAPDPDSARAHLASASGGCPLPAARWTPARPGATARAASPAEASRPRPGVAAAAAPAGCGGRRSPFSAGRLPRRPTSSVVAERPTRDRPLPWALGEQLVSAEAGPALRP